MRRVTSFINIPTTIISLLLFFQVTLADDGLKQGFKNPPPAAKVRTWWHWMNGNISKEGITADLEAMKKVGIQEAQIFNANIGIPQGSAVYLGEEWLELFKFAALEAQRLNLELAFHNCPGWSSSGGPWITPEYAMQTLVYSEVTHQGGKPFKGHLPQPETNLNYYKDIAVLVFPKPESNLRINDIDYKSLSSRIRNHLEPETKLIPTSATIKKSVIIDLTSNLGDDGFLEWNAPEGEWVILRIGHTPTGKKNIAAPDNGKGLECDKMSRDAVDVFWKGGISPIIEKLDTLVGSVLKNCIIDSYEVGCANWTPGFDTSFNRLRGYDCKLFLPALAGYYVESGEISERFLSDFRRTIGDLMAENYYAYFRDKCHEHKMTFSVEPYWGPFDNMQVGATGDIVMSEFWSGELAFFDSPKFVASIAKLNGSSIVGAEAFTDIGGWSRHPSDLKAIGDMAWAQGINRFIFHTYVHQPWNVAPGLALGPFGIDFNRLNTWWNQGSSFLDYIARGQFLLQSGTPCADILLYTGESSPNDGLLMPEIKSWGYDYDLIGRNKLQELSVKDGLICTPYGAKYHVLVLPETIWITPETLKVIEKLARSGGTILGNKTAKSPSLKNYPNSDVEVSTLSEQLWEENLIKEVSVVKFLKSGRILPDFTIEDGGSDQVDFIHRKTEESDIYFVLNSRKEPRTIKCRFRIENKQPELWDAETGEILPATVWKENGDGTTSVTIQLAQAGSVFVVFREPISPFAHISDVTIRCERQDLKPLIDLKIIKAEYGVFLPDGLVDVTEEVKKKVENNALSVIANRSLCSCDPAPGYKKELRLEYKLGDKLYEIYAKEKELVNIAANNSEELKIIKAVFGKFERGIAGIPPNNPVYDVTEQVQSKLASGLYEMPVDDSFIKEEGISSQKQTLRVVYMAKGENHTVNIPKGGSLKLLQPSATSKLISMNGEDLWLTPYIGELNYTSSYGNHKTIKVDSVPKAIELTGLWELQFPIQHKATIKEKTKELNSWSISDNEKIRHFSGTATYAMRFNLPKELLKPQNSLELDLGSVFVMAEVFLNGENMGVLWRAPYRINIDNNVKVGVNKLEVKVTNLWTNRLIGDESFTKDFERRGANIKQWPNWLLNNTPRPSKRQTFSSFRHWNKDSELLPSGMIGPVLIRSYKVVQLPK
ncbi:glycosyl hydrolase [Labilibacter marinus]|uniref:glycosyl hydrolase n=1 Tax=Labilibacter marinus TaxID=1477105 RepID=UPI00082D3AE0|nr:glycosyl hydrolase [Labilibacter marinus]